MLLIGKFESPFVRRVAVSLKLLGIGYEHAAWSIGPDLERIRQYNPLGRVPTLVLDEGEVLMDSAAILDHLDELVGPRRALLPGSGRERREALRLIALALGAAEKGRDVAYEWRFRSPEQRSEAWMARCRMQVDGALGELTAHCERRAGRWLAGGALSQADVTVTCAYSYLTQALQMEESAPVRYTALAAAVNRCEARAEFLSTFVAFSIPGMPAN
ncbi:MAG TPA: glutathione S-transferase family protein [Steroidobacteraceae bacterium]|jgi:glutathione S-transferase|nr:glutathione S-transferase family protein [Steroidobacteraceae bacterium]